MTASAGVLFISHDGGRTGAPIGLLAFAEWLRANTSHRVGTIFRNGGVLEGAFARLGPSLVLGNSPLGRTRLGRRIQRHLPASLRSEASKIDRFFKANRYDVIYSNTITNGAILQALAHHGVPVVTHVHELSYWIERAGARNLQQVTEHTNRYIAASGAVAKHLVAKVSIPPDKITVVYEHIRNLPPSPTDNDRAVSRKRLGFRDDDYVVGSCGAEHWRKGRDLIPQLLIALRQRLPTRNVRFLWVGRPGNPVEEAALAYDLAQAGLAASFHSTGEVADPLNHYHAMDAFALLSREDPYPLACLEAAAIGIPVACFDGAGGIPEFVAGGCGLAAPYLDLPAMASDLAQFATDPALARGCAERARRKVEEQNLPEKTGPQLLSVVENVLVSKP